ncbi:FG-GAP-like repeat-containing protein [Dyadobacter jiangsuensis]|uniref:Putative secreted protein (Por secretion system target) n=1 Tax=Dyadobacter jiangsuensis TaxID=1591085 RepID=A0A2P8FVD2_9BACT|nr:FG-GAP-like repeat-containing protein [Dyadobacter jiangsuensis]PSL25678.1 putative secreted protein (Por secretion system target) [Dyadobacter jiangsuensis]
MKKIYQRAMAIALAGTTLLGAGLWHQHHRISPVPAKPVTQKADALPKGISEATLADIRNSLEKQEYHISYDEQKKKLQSPNRRNNIRAYYEPGKLTVQTRVDTTGDGFKMELVNEGVFADGKLLYAPEIAAKAEHHENKVQISHQAFTEEFINNEEGVRQNFIIENAPEGTHQLQVKMAAKGLEVEQGSGNELHFFSKTANGSIRNELVYSDLKCWDGNKKPLNATLAYVDNRIQISVDVAVAAYPVTIDPIITNGTPQNSNKVLQIDQSYMWLGFSVSSAGDVNGDGYSDVIVGAPQYDLGEDNEGGAFVYKGDPSGLTATAVTFQSNQIGAKMGYSVSTAGDFNGDGFSDVIVGIPYYDKDAVDEGRANLYLGSSTFFSSAITGYGIGSGHAGALMGINVATAGDIDGNGLSDILIAASQNTNGESKEGSVLVKYGNANADLNSAASITLQINQPNAQFGYSIAPAGDIDADGYSDLIIGARWYTNGQGQEGEGATFIYHGSSNGQLSGPTIIQGNQYNAAMGNKVSSAGDVNGDGYSDILVGSYAFDHGQTDEGQVFVFHGSAGTIGLTPRGVSTGTTSGALLGSSVSIIGDYNGDGLNDILAGAPNFDGGQVGEGAVFLSFGDAATGTNSMKKLESDQQNAKLGCSVSGAGDHNGDGFDDLVIGATGGIFGGNTGVAYVYNGNAQGNFSGGTPLYQVSNKLFGTSVGSGDINRDGFTDIIVSAPLVTNDLKSERGLIAIFPGSGNGVTNANYTLVYGPSAGTKLGSSLATADVNGDGFMDIIAGAGLSSGGEGSFYVWHGGGGGIPTGTLSKIEVKSNTPNANFGASVSNAGDVNGDGFGDIIIGAPGITNGQNNEGVARVYYGSSNGIASPFNTLIEVNQAEAAFGTSVASAGDVNGDGYDDVIVGAPYYDDAVANGGGVWIFHGSYNGLNTTSSFSLKGEQVEDHFGQAVSGGGDLNGDGYSDIVVGIPGMDQSGMTNNGGVRAYFGNDGYAGKNKRNSTRLYNTNLTPMTYSQCIQNSVVVGIHATSFLGRNNGRLAWDYTQNGTSFSKVPNNPITTSTITDDAQNSFGTLSGTEVKAGIIKLWTATRLRVRFKHELATALTGQVYGPWRTVPEYLLYFPAGSPPVLAGEEFEKAVIADATPEYKDLVSVYPNPVADRLFIQSTNMDQVTSLQLISANGTMAFTSAKPQSEVDVRHLAAGSYILVINRKDGSKTSHKVLIRK